jgi:hypothetical protein
MIIKVLLFIFGFPLWLIFWDVVYRQSIEGTLKKGEKDILFRTVLWCIAVSWICIFIKWIT